MTIQEARRDLNATSKPIRRSIGHPSLIPGRHDDIMSRRLIPINRVVSTLAFVTFAEQGMPARRVQSDNDRLLSLVLRVRAGDPSARQAFAQETLARLSLRVQSANRREDRDTCDTAVADAIVEFLDHADRFDPDRLDVIDYLFIAAHRNVKDLRRSQRWCGVLKKLGKHSRNFVELDSLDSNNLWRDNEDPAISLERAEERRLMIERIEVIRSRLSNLEAIVFDLMLNGVRDTEAFAKVLNVTHLPEKERRSYVKRFKDRLMRKLKRMNGSSSQ